RMKFSLHVLKPNTLVLREEAVLHFLFSKTFSTQRQPAVFDGISAIHVRPKDGNTFACVQANEKDVSNSDALSLWRYINGGSPEDLVCVMGRVVIAEERVSLISSASNSDSITAASQYSIPGSSNWPVSWNNICSKPDITVFNSPDRTPVTAITPSPHAGDIFAVSCTSGRTFICKLEVSKNSNEEELDICAPRILHTLPSLTGPRPSSLAFHPTSTDPSLLMLAILYPPLSGGSEEVQVWCINLTKSVHLIRRLTPSISHIESSSPMPTDFLSNNYLKWSKNGRVLQIHGNTIVIHDVRKNNGVQEHIQVGSNNLTKIRAMEIVRETGMAWVLDSDFYLRVYDLLQCTELAQTKISFDTHLTALNESASRKASKLAFSLEEIAQPDLLTPSCARSSGDSYSTLRRRSSDFLSYYLNVAAEEEEDDDDCYSVRNDNSQDTNDTIGNTTLTSMADGKDIAFPATAIRATSPIWTYTEPSSGEPRKLLPDPLESKNEFMILQSNIDENMSLPDPILPDCLFTNLGFMMQDSGNAMYDKIPEDASEQLPTLFEVLFGWPTAEEDVRNLIMWERNRANGVGSSSSTFVCMVLNLWLKFADGNSSVTLLEALEGLQSNPSTKTMTVSITWLIYAMHLLTAESNERRQNMVEKFIDSVLFRDREGYGDDVEAVHLACGMLIACGEAEKALNVYLINSYYLEATMVALLADLDARNVIEQWAEYADESGLDKIALR
ncbi:hypothetical protein V1511DRAFT_445144, partial [Dipodascopsis uninucleata]